MTLNMEMIGQLKRDNKSLYEFYSTTEMHPNRVTVMAGGKILRIGVDYLVNGMRVVVLTHYPPETIKVSQRINTPPPLALKR